MALTSVSGAPGVTTTAVGWALRSDRPSVLVEAGAVGGSAVLAGVFASAYKHTTSMVTLAEASNGSGHPLIELLWEHTVVLPGMSDRWLLPGVATHQQARAMGSMWQQLGDMLHQVSNDTGTDVLVDCGRLSTAHAPHQLALGADAVLVLVDDTLASLNACSIALDQLYADMERSGGAQRLAVVPVIGRQPGRGLAKRLAQLADGGGARPFSHAEVSEVMQPVATLGPLAFDPDAAAVFSAGTLAPRRFTTSTYCRSLDALRSSTAALVRASQDLTTGASA